MVLVVSLLLTAAPGALATGQRYHNPYDIWFLPDDPGLLSYRTLTKQYGRDDFVIIAFRAPEGVFTNKALEALFDLVDRLERTPNISRVDSVANFQHVETGATTEDEVAIGDLLRAEELPLTGAELGRRERVALAEKPLVGSLLSAPSGTGQRPTTTAVIAHVLVDTPDEAVAVVDRILDVNREIEARYGYRLYVAGVPVNEHGFMTFGRSEAARFTVILFVAVLVLLAVAFRDVRGVVLPTAVVVLSVAGALGVMVAAGVWLNALTTIVPPLLITVGIAEAMHLLATFFELRRQGQPREAAVVATVTANFWPCAITSATTGIGFASLLVTTVVPMRQLGFAASVGVAFAWFVSFTLLPAALAVWPDRSRVLGPRTGADGLRPLERVVAACGRFVVARPWKVVVGMVLIFALMASFVARIRVETSYVNMFTTDTILRQGLGFIEAELGGVIDLEISLDSGRPDGVKDPVFLQKLATIQEYLNSQPEISHTISVVDILRRMHHVMAQGPAELDLPGSAELSAQYLLLYTLASGREDLKDRIDVDNRWTRLSARARTHSSSATQELGARSRHFIRDRYPELGANVTGKALLYTRLHEEMAANTVGSFVTALVPITIVQSLLFWSIKVGLLTMIPNLLPILAVAGLMGLLGIPLDPGSAMVGQVAIGIVVDDTVHFFSKYLAMRSRGQSPEESVLGTLGELGRPVVFTTIILAVGFSVFSFSHFNFIAYFGKLAATVIVLALAADLFMTPALLLTFDTARRPLVGRLRRPAPVPGHEQGQPVPPVSAPGSRWS